MGYPHRYKNGKNLKPITKEELEQALNHPHNKALEFKAFIVLLYYTGVRVTEAVRTLKEQFQVTDITLYWDVGTRLKHGRHTQPLPLSLKQPHMDLLLEQVNRTRKGRRVFGFTRFTAWRHLNCTAIGCNHRARLTAITFFLEAGFSVAEIINWFGITAQTVNDYVGLVSLAKMGAVER